MSKFYIVAIGCSAGGTPAYNELLSKLPLDINAAFVVVQHLHPDFESINYQLVREFTSLNTFRAEHNQILEPGCIYFIPENSMMTISQGRLQLRTRRKDELINRAVDIFFSSLAIDAKSKAIGVILSGFGKDGGEGVLAIQKAGGIVMIQTPRYALYKSMPQAVLAHHQPHFILPPDELAVKISQIVGQV